MYMPPVRTWTGRSHVPAEPSIPCTKQNVLTFKGMRGLRNSVRVLQIAFTYIGTIVGAGFATGREILQFLPNMDTGLHLPFC